MTGDWWTLAASHASQLRHTGTHLITIVIIIIIVSPSSLLSHHVSSSLSPFETHSEQQTTINIDYERRKRDSNEQRERLCCSLLSLLIVVCILVHCGSPFHSLRLLLFWSLLLIHVRADCWYVHTVVVGIARLS